MKTSNYITICLLLAPALLPNQSRAGDDATATERLLDRISQQEREFTARLRTRSAILETYIQELPDSGEGDVVRDHYFLGRLEFSKNLNYVAMSARESPQEGRIPFLKNRAAIFVPTGFGQMALIDADGIDRDRYNLAYVRREFLGDVRCLAFDVSPRDKKAQGKFIGRIWVEDLDDRIVRFNGTYTNSSARRLYFHFDSWRVQTHSGEWIPAYIYVEESQPMARAGNVPRFKAQTRLWGYDSAGAIKISELSSIAVEAEQPVQDQSDSGINTPLESRRSWEHQSETNIIERLQTAGLIAPEGPVDQVLNTVVNNLIVSNNLAVEAKCRVMLTTPLETFSIGQTIVISRGLIDVLPDEASLAMALAPELAHIALGHRSDTHFAFSDQIMWDNGELLRRVRFTRPATEIDAAGEKAVAMLAKSPYQGKLASAGLFLKALAARSGSLPALIRANLGNQLATDTNLARMAPLAAQAPALEQDKLEQVAALPLGSRIQVDPWSGQIVLVKPKPVALLSPRDKMPFEATPFMIFLSRAEVRPKDQDPGGKNPPVQR